MHYNKPIIITAAMLLMYTTLFPAAKPIMAHDPQTYDTAWRIQQASIYSRQGFNTYAGITFNANDLASRLEAGSLQAVPAASFVANAPINAPITAQLSNAQQSEYQMPIWQLVHYADKFGRPSLSDINEANWNYNFFAPWACAMLATGIGMYTKADPKKIAFFMAFGGFAFTLYNTVQKVHAQDHATRIDARTTELISTYKDLEKQYINTFWTMSSCQYKAFDRDAAHRVIDDPDYVPYVHADYRLTAATKALQMQVSRGLFRQRATNDILNPYEQERWARIWSGVSVCAASLAATAWRHYFVIPA